MRTSATLLRSLVTLVFPPLTLFLSLIPGIYPRWPLGREAGARGLMLHGPKCPGLTGASIQAVNRWTTIRAVLH